MHNFFYRLGHSVANMLILDTNYETEHTSGEKEGDKKSTQNGLKPCLDSSGAYYDNGIHILQIAHSKMHCISMRNIMSFCDFPVLLVGSFAKLEPRFSFLQKFLYTTHTYLLQQNNFVDATNSRLYNIQKSKQETERHNKNNTDINSQLQLNEKDTQYTVPVDRDDQESDGIDDLPEEMKNYVKDNRGNIGNVEGNYVSQFNVNNSKPVDTLFFSGFTFKHSSTGISRLYILIPEQISPKSKCIFVLLTTESTALVFTVNNTTSIENDYNENVVKFPYYVFSKFLEQRGFTFLSSSTNTSKTFINLPVNLHNNDPPKEEESLHWFSSSIFFSEFESQRFSRIFWILCLKSLILNDTKTDAYVKYVENFLVRKTGSENFKKKIQNEFCNSDNEESEERANIWFEIHDHFAGKRAKLKDMPDTNKIKEENTTLNFKVDEKYSNFWFNFNSWFTKLIQQVPNSNVINNDLDCFNLEFKADKATVATERVSMEKDKSTSTTTTSKSKNSDTACQYIGVNMNILNNKSENGFSSITGEEEVEALLDESVYSDYINSNQMYEVRRVELVSQPIVNAMGELSYHPKSTLQTLITTFQSHGADLLKNLKKRDVYYWDLSSRKKIVDN